MSEAMKNAIVLISSLAIAVLVVIFYGYLLLAWVMYDIETVLLRNLLCVAIVFLATAASLTGFASCGLYSRFLPSSRTRLYVVSALISVSAIALSLLLKLMDGSYLFAAAILVDAPALLLLSLLLIVSLRSGQKALPGFSRQLRVLVLVVGAISVPWYLQAHSYPSVYLAHAWTWWNGQHLDQLAAEFGERPELAEILLPPPGGEEPEPRRLSVRFRGSGSLVSQYADQETSTSLLSIHDNIVGAPYMRLFRENGNNGYDLFYTFKRGVQYWLVLLRPAAREPGVEPCQSLLIGRDSGCYLAVGEDWDLYYYTVSPEPREVLLAQSGV